LFLYCIFVLCFQLNINIFLTIEIYSETTVKLLPPSFRLCVVYLTCNVCEPCHPCSFSSTCASPRSSVRSLTIEIRCIHCRCAAGCILNTPCKPAWNQGRVSLPKPSIPVSNSSLIICAHSFAACPSVLSCRMPFL